MPVRIARRLLIGLTVVLAAAVPLSPVRSQDRGGDGLLVAPTRVVLEGRQRTAEITLLNTGLAPSTYRIGFVQMRMRADGSFEEILTPGEGDRFADHLVRYSPRQVVLAPHVPQTIRILLRKPAGLPSGEYRSHLLFRGVPAAGAEGGPRETAAPAGLNIQLTPIYGISIPVIIRHGDTSATATLSDLGLRADSLTGEPTLRFAIQRQGNRSLFGDITVTRDVPGGGRQVVAVMKGVAVYVPNAVRHLTVPLPSANPTGQGQRFRVTYTAPDGGQVLATAELFAS